MERPTLTSPGSRTAVMRLGLIVLLAVAGSALLLCMPDELRPGSRSYRPPSRITAASYQATTIAKALRLYAEDHEGRFPVDRQSARHAFRDLIGGGYLADENLFYVAGSAWHDEAPQRKPDNDIGAKPDFAQALERGENHWAYVSGLTAENDPKLPLMADGFVEGEPGRYTDDPSKKGGLWKGTKAIIVFVDGSAYAWPISAKDGFRVRKRKKDGSQVDIFNPEGGLPESARVLNPW
jgi:hypothetical protein